MVYFCLLRFSFWFSVKNLLQSHSYNNKYEGRLKWASAIEIVEVYNILYSLKPKIKSVFIIIAVRLKQIFNTKPGG